jgi:RNA polymerase sigma factor (sigma-70 family)
MAVPPEPTFSVEELLAHADWLRRLATHVARGDAGSEDAVQETFLAALRSRPTGTRPLQPWLAEVLRNFIRRSWRGERARQARETAVGEEATASVPTPETLLARAEAQRRLADRVLALPEPFRATVLLRYFEGHSAAEIARVTGVPAGTVRWRLKEGLERLRALLDEGPDRDHWRALLLPLPAAPLVGTAGAKATASTGPMAGTATGATGTGVMTGGMKGIVMATVATKKPILAGLAVLVALLVTAVLLVAELWWRAGRERHAGLATGAIAAGPTPRSAPPRFAAAVALPTGEVVSDDSIAGSVEGVVRSAEDGSAIAGAELVFAYGESSLSSRADAEGRFRFQPGVPGTYLLARIAAERFHPFAPEWGDSPVGFVLRAGERVRGVELTLRPERRCQGRVLDQAGQPAGGARLVMWPLGRGSSLPGGASATADAAGRFELPAIGGVTVEAHLDERSAREQLGPALPPCQLTLRLGPPRPAGPAAPIAGRVVRAGAGVAGAIVEAWSNPVLQAQARHGFARTTTDADGQFTLDPLDGALYEVSAHLGGRQLATAREVRGGTSGLVLTVAAGGSVRGEVKDEAGRAITRFTVVVSKIEGIDDARIGIDTRFGAFTRYDASGAFAIDDVPAGDVRVLVVADGRAPSDEQIARIAAAPASAPNLMFVLRPGARVRGRVLERGSRAPLSRALVSIEGRAGIGGRNLQADAVPLTAQVMTGDDGRYDLGGVPHGRLSLTVAASDHHGRVLGGLEVIADRPLELPDIELGRRKEGEPARIELVGIGASLAPKGDVMVVGPLTPKGGAALAGLVTGDAIVAIDGRPVVELGFADGIQRIRGAENTVVVLHVRHADGREADISVVRRLITW